MHGSDGARRGLSLKEGVRVPSQALMEMEVVEVEEHVGAARHERSAERVGQRNG